MSSSQFSFTSCSEMVFSLVSIWRSNDTASDRSTSVMAGACHRRWAKSGEFGSQAHGVHDASGPRTAHYRIPERTTASDKSSEAVAWLRHPGVGILWGGLGEREGRRPPAIAAK